jgi:hypothetical protein
MANAHSLYYFRALCAVTVGASAKKHWFLQDDVRPLQESHQVPCLLSLAPHLLSLAPHLLSLDGRCSRRLSPEHLSPLDIVRVSEWIKPRYSFLKDYIANTDYNRWKYTLRTDVFH